MNEGLFSQEEYSENSNRHDDEQQSSSLGMMINIYDVHWRHDNWRVVGAAEKPFAWLKSRNDNVATVNNIMVMKKSEKWAKIMGKLHRLDAREVMTWSSEDDAMMKRTLILGIL